MILMICQNKQTVQIETCRTKVEQKTYFYFEERADNLK
jgi:hypothetical protein